jgi:hypothetical protein
MRSPEGFSGEVVDVEVGKDPEVNALLEFLGAYTKIQEIMAWLVEAGAEADFTVKAVRRAYLQQLIQQLGLDPESPDAFTQLEQMKTGLSDRTMHPKPRVDVPDADFFKSRIKKIVSDQDLFGSPSTYGYATEGIADVVGIAQFGHTDWRSVQSRNGRDISEWIHGVANIMADPVAYHAEFAGLGISSMHSTPDHLAISEDWAIQNGRHRSLAVRSLGEEYVLEAGMSQWIQVDVEQP